jgi:hypothetical protein
MRVFAKSPMEIRIEADGKVRRSSPPSGGVDRAARPRQAGDDEEMPGWKRAPIRSRTSRPAASR